MTIRNIAQDSWRDELDSFSRQHEGWIVSIKTRSHGGAVAVAARDVPLQGVSLASPPSGDIAISVGGTRGHLTHEIHDSAPVEVDLTPHEAQHAPINPRPDWPDNSLEAPSAPPP